MEPALCKGEFIKSSHPRILMIMKRSPRTLQTKAETKCHLANNSFKKREKITENDQNQVWSEALGGGETASGERRPHVPPAHRLILVLYFDKFFISYCPQSFSGGGLYSRGNGLLLLLL